MIASAVVALGAMGVAMFQADFAKKQADAAKKQAEAAQDQASAAWEQVEVARSQVVEAQRANEEAARERAERRAREAVRWAAELEPSGKRVRVRNVGVDTARNVGVQVAGTDDDWIHRDPEDIDFDEVRSGDYFPFDVSRYVVPPDQVYVDWQGAPSPTAVVVQQP